MARQHRVQPGDCINSIALRYGFFPDTLWNHPLNAALRALRDNPDVLAPGDVVQVPDLRVREETRATGNTYRFQRRGVPARLQLQVLHEGRPLAGQPYKLTVDGGRARTGMTNDRGEVIAAIPPDARVAHLRVGQGTQVQEFDLQLGRLEPVETVAGLQARLRNLGYDCGDERGEAGPRTRAALRAFQAVQSLPVTGEPDDATRARLVQVHADG